jgi:hypothetical protein
MHAILLNPKFVRHSWPLRNCRQATMSVRLADGYPPADARKSHSTGNGGRCALAVDMTILVVAKGENA